MPEFRQRSPGDPLAFSADEVNAWGAAAKAHRGAGAGNPPSGPGIPFPGVNPANVILVTNDTGADLTDAWAALRVASGDPAPDVPTYPHDWRQLGLLPADTPAADTDAVVLTVEPIADGEIGRAVASGVAVCKVLKGATGDEFAKPIAGDNTRLAGGATGPIRILWSETGTGEKWAVVLLAQTGTARGVPFIAELTGSTVVAGQTRWKWRVYYVDVTGAYTTPGPDGGYTAIPSAFASALAASGAAVCQPFTGQFVVMWEGRTAGWQEFLPIGYADATHPGIVSLNAQTMGDGNKTFRRKVVANDAAAAGVDALTVYGANVSAAHDNPLLMVGDTITTGAIGGMSFQVGTGVRQAPAAFVGSLGVYYGPVTLTDSLAAPTTTLTLSFDPTRAAGTTAGTITFGSTTVSDDPGGDYGGGSAGGFVVGAGGTVKCISTGGFAHSFGSSAAIGTWVWDGTYWVAANSDLSPTGITFGAVTLTDNAGKLNAAGFSAGGSAGFTGTMGPGQTATIVGGIIVNVV